MKEAERYFALLHKRLRQELGSKKAKEIVEELDGHYRAKLIELQEQGLSLADASAAALEALGPIDSIVEDYSQPGGWTNVKPIERTAIRVATIGLLVLVIILAISDAAYGYGIRRSLPADLFFLVLVVGLPLFRAGFYSGRILSRQAILVSLLAVLVPATAISLSCYAHANGQTVSLIRLHRINRDEEAYVGKLKNLQNEISQAKAAFANAERNYVEVEYDPIHGFFDIRTPHCDTFAHLSNLWYIAKELDDAKRSMEQYRKGPSIDPYRTEDGFLVINGTTSEECLLIGDEGSSPDRYGSSSTRITGVTYRIQTDLGSAGLEWQRESVYEEAIKDDLATHTSVLESLKPYLNQPLADRWPSAALVFGDFIIGSFFWLMVLNIGGAISGALWRAATKRGYDKLIRS